MRNLALLLGLTACAPDLGDIHDWNDGDGPFDTGFASTLVHTNDEGSTRLTEVDATDGTVWTGVDLDAGGVEAPDDGADWDLKFQRFEIAVNGGVTGDGGVEAIWLDGQGLSDLTTVPTEGWGSDEPDGADDNELPDYVMRPWFDYDGATHVVTPHPGVFAVRSTEGRHYAVEMLSYYDEAGSSAMLSFRWKSLD